MKVNVREVSQKNGIFTYTMETYLDRNRPNSSPIGTTDNVHIMTEVDLNEKMREIWLEAYDEGYSAGYLEGQEDIANAS